MKKSGKILWYLCIRGDKDEEEQVCCRWHPVFAWKDDGSTVVDNVEVTNQYVLVRRSETSRKIKRSCKMEMSVGHFYVHLYFTAINHLLAWQLRILE